ncbi:response regulator [Polaromonas sp.]|uniref:response regulator n=1 Tax=Polaromonas sp. TaxID=1869339 RepID=UPI00375362A3
MKPIFVKYYGFSDAERHALHTLFRLSESHPVVYAPWTADGPEAAQVVLVDGDSWEAALALANPSHDKLKLAWVGAGAPASAWRVFASPVKWSALIEAMDEAFLPVTSKALSLDLALAHDTDLDVHFEGVDDTAPMALEGAASAAARRVLLVDAGRDERLYLRAKLAAAGLHEVDEAASGAEAMELLRSAAYQLVIVDLGLTDMDSWQVIKAVDRTRPAIAHLFITGAEPAWRRGLRARFSGAQVYLSKPLDPEKLKNLLQNI